MLGAGLAIKLLGFGKKYWPYLLAAALVIGAYFYVDHRGYSRAKAKYEGKIESLTKSIEAKTAEAKRKDIENARRVETAQNVVTDKLGTKHETDIANLRADYAKRLRDYQKARGSGNGTNLPGIPDAASKFDDKACSTGFLCIPTESAYSLMRSADENTRQLLDLQSWVEQQKAIPR